VSLVKNLRKETIRNEIQHALKVYHARGFHVIDIHSDMEFECVQHDFLPTPLNLTPCDAQEQIYTAFLSNACQKL